MTRPLTRCSRGNSGPPGSRSVSPRCSPQSIAGVLVLLISVTLILLKLSFLLLLIVGPFFLLIGAHPGFGRVVAMRWIELLIGVLLKQAAVALVLSVLLYCYALIMGTTDAVLPWALKILMIALVSVAAFIYRKPFQHLFSAVGYGMIGSADRADSDLARAGATARANTRTAATLAVPTFAAYRAARWAKRNPAQAASLAMAAAGGGAAAAAAGLQATDAGTATAADAAAAPDMVTAGKTGRAGTASSGGAGPGGVGTGGIAAGVASAAAVGATGSEAGDSQAALTARARGQAMQAPSAAEPPPLNLPARNGSAAAAPAAATPGTRPVWPGGRVPQARAGTSPGGNTAAPSRGPAASPPQTPRQPGSAPPAAADGVRAAAPADGVRSGSAPACSAAARRAPARSWAGSCPATVGPGTVRPHSSPADGRAAAAAPGWQAGGRPAGSAAPPSGPVRRSAGWGICEQRVCGQWICGRRICAGSAGPMAGAASDRSANGT